MQNRTGQLWLGVWLLVLPFLGIPGRWKEILTVLTALALIGHTVVRYLLRKGEVPLAGEKLGKKTDVSHPTPDSSLSAADSRNDTG